MDLAGVSTGVREGLLLRNLNKLSKIQGLVQKYQCIGYLGLVGAGTGGRDGLLERVYEERPSWCSLSLLKFDYREGRFFCFYMR